MKKILGVLIVVMGLVLSNASAQIGVSVNIGGPPAWGPYGYNDARFYFIPDIDVYYDCWNGNYWYNDYNGWTCSPNLPQCYANFNLYGAYKVVLNFNGNNPWRYYNNHRVAYARYRNWGGTRQYTYFDRGYRNGYSRGYNQGYGRGSVQANRNYGGRAPVYNGGHHRIDNGGGNRPNRGGGNYGGGNNNGGNRGGGNPGKGSGGNRGGGNGGGNHGGGGRGNGGFGGSHHR